MPQALFDQLQTVQQTLDPQFKTLRQAMAALKKAASLAAEERLDALAMQKAMVKLQQADADIDDPVLHEATAAFAATTQQVLDALAFEFARDLRAAFEDRGQSMAGRPPTLTVGELVLHIDINARKAQWFYGKEALTRPIPLSIKAILKAYDQQDKAIIQRDANIEEFLQELYTAWGQLLAERPRRPAGNRINLITTYSKLVLNRQSARFWNSPSRRTFKDYERPLFVRDMVLAQDAPTVEVDGQTYHLRLGVATKTQAGNAMRSLWLPHGPLDGDYYADITFEKA
ncbi:MAG: hypothetical protein GXP37_12955 [Chloroflexi bacterium]|nr:hypothetical protein [Chloroflexota bacterium]